MKVSSQTLTPYGCWPLGTDTSMDSPCLRTVHSQKRDPLQACPELMLASTAL